MSFSDQPLLTIAIPAYNRPLWFERALRSILKTCPEDQKAIEIIVSDDSTIVECKTLYDRLIPQWQGLSQYQANHPSLGMAGNWNACIHLSRGKYLLILHDDDYLEPNAVINILQVLKQYPQNTVFLFGVNVVNARCHILKRQYFQQQYLDPLTALKQVLTNSSFVRFPGMVIQKTGFNTVGYFDLTVGGTADLYLWVRLFYQYGLMCVPAVTANYTVHSEALTMGMFNESVVDDITRLFDWVKLQGWLSPETLSQSQTNYLHQFILAGTFRYLRRFKFKQAKTVFKLFQYCNLCQPSTILKWKLLRILLEIILGQNNKST